MRRHLIWIAVFLLACSAAVQAEVVIVLDSGDGTITRINRSTYQPIDRFFVGREPHHLMSLPDNSALIVANAVSNDLVFLNPITGDIINRIPRISDPYQIAFSPDKHWFVSNSLRLDRVDVYEAKDFLLVKRFDLPAMPSHLTFNQDSSLVFVTLQGSDQLAAIDLKSLQVKWIIPIGKAPAGIIMTPDNRYLLVGIMGLDEVAVVDWKTATIVKHIHAGRGTHNFTPLGDGRRVFVTNRAEDTVSIVDTQTLTIEKTFAVPGGPDCMELSADGKELWITSRWLRQVTVMDMTTFKVARTIPVGRSPHGIFFASHAAR